MASNDVQAWLKRGIQAAQAGDKKTAKDLFVQALKQNPRSELAWMWMVSVVDTDKERRFCLQKILEINPNNQRARQALQQMEQPAVPDWLREASLPEPPTPKATPRPTAPAPAGFGAQPDTGAPTGEAAPAAQEWADWELPDFEDEAGGAAPADASVDALRAQAVAAAEEERGRRGRRRLRRVLLFLLTVAMIVLAVIVVPPRLPGGVLGTTGTTPEATSTVAETPTEGAPADGTPTPTTAVARTRTPTPTVETPEEAGPAPGVTPPTEENTDSEEAAVYEGEAYTLTYPTGWTVAAEAEPKGNALTQITLARGELDLDAGPLPDEFALALIDTVAPAGETVEELLQTARTVASDTAGVLPALDEIESGETTIGGEPAAFEHYTLAPDADTTVYVYAAAATLEDQNFIFVLLSTDEDDRATAEAILESVTFKASS